MDTKARKYPTRPTKGSVEESEHRDEADHHFASGLGAGGHGPGHGETQLREPANSNPNHEDGSSVHLVCPKEAGEDPEQAHAGYHGGELERAVCRDSSRREEISRVYCQVG